MSAPNLVELAVSDLTTAAALLRNKRSGVTGLDVRFLAGGAVAFGTGPNAFDCYTGAIDACLAKLPGLTNKGYYICRVEATTPTQ